MRNLKKLALNYVLANLLFVFFSINHSVAQHFDFGYEHGFSSYYGDLNSFSHLPSISQGSTSKGYYLGYGNRLGTIFLNYTVSEIAASDSNSANSININRNLSFRSPIIEFGLTAEFNVLSLFANHYGYTKFQVLAISGINVFQFNPYTLYQGEKLNLQPLGTEGQGTSLFPESEKYSLSEISIPLGLAFKYELTNKIWVGLGSKIRMTFTDYLDDVSGNYVEPESLIAQNGALSAELAYRGDEISNLNSIQVGTPRGNDSAKDWYMTTYLTLGFRFKEDKIYRKRKSRSKVDHLNTCPSF